MSVFKDKVLLITGGTGSFGNAVLRRFLDSDIDDLRESPAKQIVSRVMQSCNNADILVVEPNVKTHNVFKLTDYKEAYDKADIVVFLTAHMPFKSLSWSDDKVILDFCGIFKK